MRGARRSIRPFPFTSRNPASPARPADAASAPIRSMARAISPRAGRCTRCRRTTWRMACRSSASSSSRRLPAARHHARAVGASVWAVKGGGAHVRLTEFSDGAFRLGAARRVAARHREVTRTFLACVPMTGRMAPAERELGAPRARQRPHRRHDRHGRRGRQRALGAVRRARRDLCFGAGEDLDLAPPQVIAQEAGLTVWGPDRRPPVWQCQAAGHRRAERGDCGSVPLRAAGF